MARITKRTVARRPARLRVGTLRRAATALVVALGAAFVGTAPAQGDGAAPASAVIARYPLCDDPRSGGEGPYLQRTPDPGLDLLPRGGAEWLAVWEDVALLGEARLAHPYLTRVPERSERLRVDLGVRADAEGVVERSEVSPLERDTRDGLLYTCP